MKTDWYSMASQIQVQQNDPRPLQYVVGWTFFCGEWFLIDSSVLIPRIETEGLVNHIVNLYKKKSKTGKKLRILELGTGSGNIAIMLAKKLNADVCAVDISKDALNTAAENARVHGVKSKIEFVESNWYSKLDIKPYDFIVSNPPYISKEEWSELPEEVTDYEPHKALYGGTSGLVHYKEIINGSKDYLASDGMIFLEIGYKQSKMVKQLMRDFTNIKITLDQNGNERIVSGKINY